MGACLRLLPLVVLEFVVVMAISGTELLAVESCMNPVADMGCDEACMRKDDGVMSDRTLRISIMPWPCGGSVC